MNLKRLAALALLFIASAAVQAQNVLDFPQPDNVPDEFYAVTEIPAGGAIKYETDAKTGFIVADRFQSMPVAWPANYGSLTQSLGFFCILPHDPSKSFIRCERIPQQ